jgi:uncharacterized protein (DUF983 family)
MADGAVPVWRAALLCRCPRCGEGRLFSGLLKMRERCERCGLDLRRVDTGDGPAVLGMFIVMAVVFGLAAWVDFAYEPPLWLHFVIWPIVTVVLAVLTMRPLKAALVALQFRLRASEMGL